MKRILASIIVSVCPLAAFAQPGLVSVHEATPDGGRLLTMEETILSRQLNPSFPGADAVRAILPRPASRKSWSEGGSLYLDRDGRTLCIAESTEDGIVYGETVSRNEFGIDGGIFWSPDSTRLAFYRKDEREVSKFPLLDITTRTGSLREIRYPMAGMASEHISLGVYDIASGFTSWIIPEEFTDERYLTNISWTPDSRGILIQVLNREQNEMHLNLYDAANGSFIKTILTEKDRRYVEPLDPVWFVEGRDDLFIYRTENRDAYRNLYLCGMDGTVTRLTCTDADVHYVCNDGKYVYYTSAEVSPVENHLFRVELRKKGGRIIPGKVTRLTFEEGWHHIYMSPDKSWFYDYWTNINNPGSLDKASCDGRRRERVADAEDPTGAFAYCEIVLGTVKSADGIHDNWYRMVKPLNFDPTKKYPVIVYVYGGPHSQMVRNTWLAELRRWEMYMAQRGWLVYVQDNRGTENRGAEFEKVIHRQCGQAEMDDQMEGIRMLKSLPYVDADRIGVHGWSYGGFMTISLMTNYPETFKVGVAGGPVIDWKWYEVMYGERYMDTPQENPEGYSRTSLMEKCSELKGKLLICQGAIDNTVLWEHSLSFVQKCIEEDVQLDYFPYPCSEHNVFGKWRVHLMDKVTEYFETWL